MLRARACKQRDSPFVCELCRHKLLRTAPPRSRSLSTLAGPAKLPGSAAIIPLPRTPIWTSRSFATTAALSNSSNNGGPPRPGSFPGGFASLGSFGSFASGANRAANDSKPGNVLLPHEREARQNTATPQPEPSPAPAARQPSTSSPPPPPSRFARAEREPRANTSRGNVRSKGMLNGSQAKPTGSDLIDVFSLDRKPQTPPTPSSWSSNHQQQDNSRTANGKPRQGRGLVDFSSKPSKSRPAPGWGDLGIRDPSKSTEAPKPARWGAFSSRKSDTTDKAKPSSMGAQLAQQRRSDTSSSMKKRSAASDNEFWDELENRVAEFKPSSQSWTATSKGEPGLTSQTLDLGLDQEGAQGWGEPASSKPRRSSRFEQLQEEEDSRPKKSKQRQRRGTSRRGNDLEDEWDEESAYRWEQKQRRKAEKGKNNQVEVELKAVSIFLPEYISVTNLAKAIKQPSKTFLRDLEEMGFENITDDTIMTGETAALVVQEYGFDPTVDSGSRRDLQPRPTPEDVTSLPSRPPVVTIMGHVDHGKTTLLDWLRKSSVAAQEHGGITQHIGAFIVKMSSGSPITFLDTPGHAAFLSMRQRGASVTDIVVLVVAADDSVMPQTLEALKHATAAKVPIIVAISKIDKEDARVEQVKADLARHGVQIEDYGGDVQVVGVSGKTGKGMDDLEENIVTLAEMLDVRSELDGLSEGWILESSVKQDGKVATVLVKRGTLRPGDLVVAGKTWARIRVLRNEAGVELSEAPPGTPVEILGWRELPAAGEQVLQAPDEDTAKTAVEYRQEMAERLESSIQLAEQEQRQRDKAAAEAAAETLKKNGIEASDTPAEPGIKYQNFTVKADVAGSVEAVCASILELGNHEVRPRILRSLAGQVTESDVDHAAASNAVIVNFNSPIQPHIKHRAEEAKVKILDHSVIYHVIDDTKSALEVLLPDLTTSRVLGEADILQVFDINIKKKVFRSIAGCRVRNGSIKKSSMVRVLRRGEVVFDGKIDTLRHVKKDVNEMGKGTECGIGLDGFQEIRVDDQIQTYELVHEKRHL